MTKKIQFLVLLGLFLSLLGITCALIVTAQVSAPNLSIKTQAEEPYIKTYETNDYETELDEFTLEDYIYIEVYSPSLNENNETKEECKVEVVSKANEDGIEVILEETEKNSSLFRGYFVTSYDESVDSEDDPNHGKIECDRFGDEVEITVNYGAEEETITLEILYDPMNNLVHDTWQFDYFGFFLSFAIGLIIGVVPEKMLKPILSKIPWLGKKYEGALDSLDTLDQAGEDFNPFLVWKMIIVSILYSIPWFIVKVVLQIEIIPQEYINEGLVAQYVFMGALAGEMYGLAGLVIGLLIPATYKMFRDIGKPE